MKQRTDINQHTESDSYSWISCGVTKSYSYTTYAPSVSPGSDVILRPTYVNSSRSPYDHSVSFRRVIKSGVIRMTPYSAGTRRINYQIASLPNAQGGEVWVPAADDRCLGICRLVRGPKYGYTTWTDNWCSDNVSALPVMSDQDPDIESRIQKAVLSSQNSATSDSDSTYDALTDLLQLKQTVGDTASLFQSAASRLQKIAGSDETAWSRGRHMSPRQLLRHSEPALRKLGAVWLGYRYFVMPLVYSAQDIRKLVKERHSSYLSSRGFGNVSSEPHGYSPPSSTYLFDQYTESVSIRSTVRKGYSLNLASVAAADQLGINPFVTAWELIPLSFVVDWFVNVGNWIGYKTHFDLSSSQAGCTSIKRSGTRVRSVVDPREKITLSFAGDHYYSCTRPAASLDLPVGGSGVIEVETWDTYERLLFPPTVRLTVDPFLNWKRFLDGVSLGIQPLTKALRRLLK